jgi:hypothetical protein
MNLIELIVTTHRGWIIRQLLKAAAYLGTAATVWLGSHSVRLDNPDVLGAALGTLLVAVAEFAFSKVASRFAASP